VYGRPRGLHPCLRRPVLLDSLLHRELFERQRICRPMRRRPMEPLRRPVRRLLGPRRRKLARTAILGAGPVACHQEEGWLDRGCIRCQTERRWDSAASPKHRPVRFGRQPVRPKAGRSKVATVSGRPEDGSTTLGQWRWTSCV
jgi:hypothetical protein